MTYAEWQGCRDLDAMLTFARRRGHFTGRQRRLFARACCGRLEHLLPQAHRRALAVAERFADGRASQEELATAWSAAYHVPATRTSHAAWAACAAAHPGEAILPLAYLSSTSLYAANAVADRPHWTTLSGPRSAPVWHAERARHRAALRDVVWPCRPHSPAAAWRSPQTLAVARAIYEENRFDDLPILADALEELECDNVELLAHLRGGGEHIRGCWALDLLLHTE